MSVYAPDRRQQRLEELIQARDGLNKRIRSMLNRTPAVLTKASPAPATETVDWRATARPNQAELAQIATEVGLPLHINHPRSF